MITCQDAKHLFDRYLDGELSASLQAELHAHQLSCSDCQGELALLESCGDVIAYDRCEPTLSASFTDRVLLANRTQFKAVAPRRSWNRLVLSIASPLAAAACIGFAVLTIAPTTPTNRNVVAGRVDQASVATLAIYGTTVNPDQQSGTVQQMPPGIVDLILDPVVKQTRNTLDSTKRSLEQLNSLVGLGFSGANDALAAGLRNMDSSRQKAAISSPAVNGPDMLSPTLPYEAPFAPDSSNSSELDDTIEAL